MAARPSIASRAGGYMVPSSVNQDTHPSTPRCAVSRANCVSASINALRSFATSTPSAQPHASARAHEAPQNRGMYPPVRPPGYVDREPEQKEGRNEDPDL